MGTTSCRTEEDLADGGAASASWRRTPHAAPTISNGWRGGIGLGLARVIGRHHGSGEIFCAPSGREVAPGHRQLNPLFAAVVEAAEEALLNSLIVADTVTAADEHIIAGLPRRTTVLDCGPPAVLARAGLRRASPPASPSTAAGSTCSAWIDQAQLDRPLAAGQHRGRRGGSAACSTAWAVA